jgi:hypothetical protein
MIAKPKTAKNITVISSPFWLIGEIIQGYGTN